jgi:hypothetical protein
VSAIKKLTLFNAECGIQNTKNGMDRSAKGITRVFVFLLAKDLSFILEK